MEIFVIIVLTIVIWHFVYESIIVPSVELKIRHDLFVQRDKLYDIKLSSSLTHGDKEVVKIMDKNINFMIDKMCKITFYSVFQFKKLYESNSNVRMEIDAIEQKIKASKNQDIHDIDKKLSKIAMHTMLINSGGWLIYLVPFAIVKLMISDFIQSVKQTARETTFLSNHQFNNIQSRRFA